MEVFKSVADCLIAIICVVTGWSVLYGRLEKWLKSINSFFTRRKRMRGFCIVFLVIFFSVYLIASIWLPIEAKKEKDEAKTSIAKLLNHPIPSLPRISFEPLPGLPPTVTPDEHLRTWRLKIANDCDVEIFNLRSRIQLPEPISAVIATNCPVGSVVRFAPIRDFITAIGAAGKTKVPINSAVFFPPHEEIIFTDDAAGELESLSSENDFSGIWEMDIDRIVGGV